jgi:hypothetical protein
MLVDPLPLQPNFVILKTIHFYREKKLMAAFAIVTYFMHGEIL